MPARRTLLGLVFIVVATASTGCHTGMDAQTTDPYTAPAGTNVRTGDVDALNLLIVEGDDSRGVLVAGLVNETDADDALESVAATDTALEFDAAQITVTQPEQPIVLPAHGLVKLADPDSADSATTLVLEGDAVQAGAVLSVRLVFAQAASITAEVPVVPRSGTYASVPTPPTVEETAAADN